jgi:hypothetical protein
MSVSYYKVYKMSAKREGRDCLSVRQTDSSSEVLHQFRLNIILVIYSKDSKVTCITHDLCEAHTENCHF